MKFKTRILQFGNNTGIPVTEKMLTELGGGKKPLVKVTLNNYSYRSAVGKMSDQFLISLSAENRKNANVKGGDEVEVDVVLDTEPRTVALPPDFETALRKNQNALTAFETLSPGKQKAMVLSITDAKTEETKNKRIEKAMQQLGEGKV